MGKMKRRQFIALLAGGATAWPLRAGAQEPGRLHRIGVLVNLPADDPQTQVRLDAFRQGLAKLGWSEGRNLGVDYRFSVSTIEQGETPVKELIGLQPEVILAHGTPAVMALRKATGTVPVVFVVVSEPVAQGFVQSLSHPGGNITGFSYLEPSLGAKWLELLMDIAPRLVRVATIFNPETAPNARLFFHSVQIAAQKFTVELIESPVHDPAGIEEAMVKLASEPGGGLIVLPDVFTGLHRKAIFERAAHHRLPAVYSFPNYATEGGLMAYGVHIGDLYRRSAEYVDRILRGAKPADLPVEQPIKFELVINLTTAKALGLTIPATLLATADEVIE